MISASPDNASTVAWGSGTLAGVCRSSAGSATGGSTVTRPVMMA